MISPKPALAVSAIALIANTTTTRASNLRTVNPSQGLRPKVSTAMARLSFTGFFSACTIRRRHKQLPQRFRGWPGVPLGLTPKSPASTMSKQPEPPKRGEGAPTHAGEAGACEGQPS